MDYKDIEKKICENIKKLRVKKKMTQKEIAEQLEISLSLYQKLEQGNRTFSTKQLFLLAKIFDVNIDFFYSDYFLFCECFSETGFIYDRYNLTENNKKEMLNSVLQKGNLWTIEKEIFQSCK